MKKILSLFFVAYMAVSVNSEATVSVALSRTDAITVSWVGAGDPTTQSLPIGSLVQMIWSADQNLPTALTTADISTVSGSSWGGAANDYVLYSALTTVTGGWSGDYDGSSASYGNSLVGSQNINNGYIYAVVFSAGTPVAGTYYGFTQWANVLGSSTPPLPDSTNLLNPIPTIDASPSGGRLNLSSSYAGNTFGGNQVQVVPEPSTIGLILVGVGLVAARRFRKS
jgi:hypothetical protein